MQTVPRKRIEIFVELPLLRRLLATMDELGLPGYSLMDISGGRGAGTAWSESGEIGNASQMVAIVSLIDPDLLEPALQRIAEIIAGRIGVASISDVEVVAEAR
ncbi:MAG: transcriptional regulator [Bradyrhizobium sp.]|uniref:P-II family nitrogen regulator n=1 Tax=Bradyrhizobium sp. TaxID=376 RepID=UPI00353F5C04